MLFDGADDVVRVSCDDSLRLGKDDFTVAGWVKYSASTIERPMVVGYEQDGAASSFKLTARPDGSIKGSIKGRIIVDNVDADGKPAKALRDVVQEVTTATGLDNDRWHHVVLQRQGAALMLSVDGGAKTTTTAGTLLPGKEGETPKPVSGLLLDLRVSPPTGPALS
ncbi:LamG-like jellyroll fold domain-containing protein [Streptomyces sp. NPDC090445]|uniref:LamG-like jellyroll fold domain-containing protein n=1 Tax=Streptomyces sp. NPDC090445 TaxID=3365963 RepID=UPI00381F971F